MPVEGGFGMTVYVSGDWYVKPGSEREFASRWRRLAEESVAEIEPDARMVLLRDREDRSHFRSFGEFRNEDAIIRWRYGSVFGERLVELKDLLDVAGTSVFDIEDVLGTAELR
jgi:hypothetical protein